MITSTILMNNHIYDVKDKKLTDDYNEEREKFDNIVDESRAIGVEVTEGKKEIAETITSKNVITEPDATFETMADNVSKIDHNIGYTPLAQTYTRTIPYKKFMLEYPYRYYMEPRDADDAQDMIIWDINYSIPKSIPTKLSIISRVKRLNENWNGVYFFTTLGYTSNYCSANVVFQLISNTELYYCRKSTNIEIPDISSWEEMVLEFKYETDTNEKINISVNIAQVIDNEIQEFIEVHSEKGLTDFYWAYTGINNKLILLGTKNASVEVAPSAVNMNDCALVVNGKIHKGNTSLYPFPEGFTVD